VVVVNGAPYRGPKEIAQLYATLIRDLPDAVWRTDVAVIHDDLAYVEWACRCAAASVKFGTDTFVVTDGLITRQTASFSIDVGAAQDARLASSSTPEERNSASILGADACQAGWLAH
jgi:hypothetical protein